MSRRTRTPGHPEYGWTPGVEVTTGPLGQGFANGVGMAIAEAHLAAEFNKPAYDIFDNYIYAIVTDGDLMEGVASEAASLAGHLSLGRLIYLYDDNRISIDGSTDIAFTEDRAARFEAYGWQVLRVRDGNDVEAIDTAIQKAKQDARPSLIVCRTHIGYGLPKQDNEKCHGTPPSDDDLNAAKVKLGYPTEPRFYVHDDVLAHFREALTNGKALQEEWELKRKGYRSSYPELAGELNRRLSGKLPDGWEEALPKFPVDAKGVATRAASGKTINALAKKLPELLGGSADLAPSNNTWIDGLPDFQKDTPEGRNFHFGVREFGMAAIINGISVYGGGLIPYCATFLVFSDYMRGAIRVSALSHYPTIWILTHDSIGVGEDGPTHQPVEHVAALRAIPNLVVLRPADGNETAQAWKIAVERRNGPTALILSRQNLPTLESIYNKVSMVERGAYVLEDLGDKDPDIILMASGSEVNLITQAGKKLALEGIKVRLVSFPSWELFSAQDKNYRDSVLLRQVKNRLAVEAGVGQGWERWVGSDGDIISIERFGASAPAERIFQEFGFSIDNIVARAKRLLG